MSVTSSCSCVWKNKASVSSSWLSLTPIQFTLSSSSSPVPGHFCPQSLPNLALPKQTEPLEVVDVTNFPSVLMHTPLPYLSTTYLHTYPFQCR